MLTNWRKAIECFLIPKHSDPWSSEEALFLLLSCPYNDTDPEKYRFADDFAKEFALSNPELGVKKELIYGI